jgi:hypothetical protein
MPDALHKLLFTRGHGFSPVMVLAVNGDMLAVMPAAWNDHDTFMNERFDDATSPAVAVIWNTTKGGKHFEKVSGYGFWVYGPVCNFAEVVEALTYRYR